MHVARHVVIIAVKSVTLISVAILSSSELIVLGIIVREAGDGGSLWGKLGLWDIWVDWMVAFKYRQLLPITNRSSF